MKINRNILSIPPYISTSWRNINSIYTENSDLIILLNSNEKISIPNLEKSIINVIFDAHSKFLEQKNVAMSVKLPIPLGDVEGIDSINSIMQHDQKNATSPNLPSEIIDKIQSIFKIMGIEDKENFPKPEPHCNCPHCQIARAIRGEKKETLEEVVSEEDLKFRDWDIKQTGDKLYEVIHPIDKTKHFSVFLGKPIGCTCGKKNCIHIKAVLRS
jgi:hypothetical protein